MFGLTAAAGAATVGYDPSLGSLPEAQGWGYHQDGAPVAVPAVVSGVLQQGPTDFSGHQYWDMANTHFDFTAGTVTVDARLHILASTFNAQPRGGYGIFLIDDMGRIAGLHISGGSVFLTNDSLTGASSIVSFDSTDAFHDYRMTAGPTGIALSIDGNAIVSAGFGAPDSPGAQIFFGDATILGSNTSELAALTVQGVTVPEPVGLGVLGLLCAGLARRVRRG